MLLNEILENTKYDDALFSEEARQFVENAIITRTVKGKRNTSQRKAIQRL